MRHGRTVQHSRVARCPSVACRARRTALPKGVATPAHAVRAGSTSCLTLGRALHEIGPRVSRRATRARRRVHRQAHARGRQAGAAVLVYRSLIESGFIHRGGLGPHDAAREKGGWAVGRERARRFHHTPCVQTRRRGEIFDTIWPDRSHAESRSQKKRAGLDSAGYKRRFWRSRRALEKGDEARRDVGG